MQTQSTPRTAFGRGRELSIIANRPRLVRLPLVRVDWLAEAVAGVEFPNRFRKGQKPPNAGRRFPATPPSKDEMLRFLDQGRNGMAGTRNRALLIVLWRAGLRCQEALDLLPHDIDYDAQTVTVLAGKGGKRRVVGIDLWALEQIQDWYVVRAGLNVPHGAPLFCAVIQGKVGQPLTGTYVRQVVKRLSTRAEIPHRMAPHQLRHALACDLAREGAPLHLLSRQLGHSHIGTTATYLQGISNSEVVELMAARGGPVVAA